jgi:hypothetical protein
MGYRKIITYILETEPGTSLKATGWICECEKCGGVHGKTVHGQKTGTLGSNSHFLNRSPNIRKTFIRSVMQRFCKDERNNKS